MRFPREKQWQGQPFIGTTRTDGGFTAAEIKTPGLEYRNHAIHIRTDGKIQLAGAGERIDGFFMNFEGGDLVLFRDTSKGQWARNGTALVIDVGSRLVGAERAVTDVTKATYGYVKPIVTLPTGTSAANVKVAIDNLAKAVNNIVRGPKGVIHATVANYPPADVVVEFGIASSN